MILGTIIIEELLIYYLGKNISAALGIFFGVLIAFWITPKILMWSERRDKN